MLPSLVTYLLVANRGQLLPICRHHEGSSSLFCVGRALLLCDGTLEFLCDGTLELETEVASTRARPYARSCVERRLRGLEGVRTADGAASREYDGRRARAMSVGPPFEMASSPPSMCTVSRSSKSPFGPAEAGPTPPSENAAPLLVPFDPDVSCSAASPISVRFST